MKKITSINRSAIYLAAMILLGNAQGCDAMTPQDEKLSTSLSTIELAAVLQSVSMPTSLKRVELLLGHRLRVVQDTDYARAYEASGPITTSDGHVIARVDVRLAKQGAELWKPGDNNIIYVDFIFDAKGCAPLKPVHDLLNMDRPTSLTGPAPGNITSFSRPLNWGTMYLSFYNSTPECIHDIGISAFK